MREIPLSRGMVALVDNEDYEWLSQWKWQAKRSPPNHWSAYGRVNGVPTFMHRLLIHVPDGMMVDHINRNSLDNRKENLRVANAQENARNRSRQSNNSSGFTGVYYNKKLNKWQVQIKVNGRHIHLGVYSELSDAVFVRKSKEKELFGEFGNENR